MNAVLEQLAPETIHALLAQATASGLSVDEYLQQLLGLGNGEAPTDGFAITAAHEEAPQPNEMMLSAIREVEELQKEMRFTPGGERTVDIIRQGRAGEMYGYEPNQ